MVPALYRLARELEQLHDAALDSDPAKRHLRIAMDASRNAYNAAVAATLAPMFKTPKSEPNLEGSHIHAPPTEKAPPTL